MKKTKGLLAIILAVAMMLSFASCSGGKKGSPMQNAIDENGILTWYLGDDELDEKKAYFDGVQNTLDPQSVYASLTIDEKMLTGSYALANEDELDDVRKNMPFKDYQFGEDTYNMSALPVGVCFGKDHICNSVTNYLYSDYKAIDDADLAVLQFTTKEDLGTTVCTFSVEGNKLIFNEIDQTSEDGEPFAYKESGTTFEYNFTLVGPYITLTDGTNNIKLTAYGFTDNVFNSEVRFDGVSTQDTPIFGDLDRFCSGYFNFAARRSGDYYYKFATKVCDNGLVTFYMYDDTDSDAEPIIKQFVYIMACDGDGYGNGGVRLFDGEKMYDYTDSILSREESALQEQGVDTSAMEEEKIQEIADKKSDLFKDLQAEFAAQGISATINTSTGEIALDSTVLFGGDSAELTADGKAFLDKFVSAYTSIIYNEKYDGFIEKTIIEGHIAPVAGTTYEGGMPLSEKRANNVKDYCLSGEIGADTSKLASTIETIGYSQSKPVLDENGNVDMDASRRVSFRFTVNVNA